MDLEQSHGNVAVVPQQSTSVPSLAAERAQPRRVVVYDARLKGADLAPGLLRAFSDDPAFFMRHAGLWERMVGSRTAELGGAGVVAGAAGIGHPNAEVAASTSTVSAAQSLLSKLWARAPPLADVVERFIEACEAEGSYPCLVVDEVRCAAARP